MSVPEGFFDTLPKLIDQRIAQLPEKKHTLTRRLWVPVATVAAMLGLLAFLFWLLKPVEKEVDMSQYADVLRDHDAIIEYLIATDGIDQESLIEAVPENYCNSLNVLPYDSISPAADTNEYKGTKEVKLVLDSTITSDDILQYLMDEGVEAMPSH
jgi:hypothetical protein